MLCMHDMYLQFCNVTPSCISMYSVPPIAAGISALDIRTRLRITEAELAIVQRELSDLLAERSLLEASSRQYEESWRYVQCTFCMLIQYTCRDTHTLSLSLQIFGEWIWPCGGTERWTAKEIRGLGTSCYHGITEYSRGTYVSLLNGNLSNGRSQNCSVIIELRFHCTATCLGCTRFLSISRYYPSPSVPFQCTQLVTKKNILI